jgi:endonuclease/exonuclease/phosphatase family metal-dependent hydrolase
MLQKRVPDQTIRVTTWNVARMGELAQNHKRETKQERLHCVHKTLMNVQTDIFALQEISKSRVAALEESMDLKCKHIDYYGTGRGHLGGLAICTHREGALKINFARNFQLPGRWRALFAEIESSASLDKKRFNVLNVHFLPHKISPRKIKNAMEDLAQGSIHSSLDLIKRMIHTTRMQGTQAEALMQVIHTFIDPTMIVGDFNSPAHSKVHWVLGQEWTDTWKAAGRDFGATRYFAGWLPFRVDFIYAHRHTFQTLSSFVEPSKCSDHYPLSTDVLLQEAE